MIQDLGSDNEIVYDQTVSFTKGHFSVKGNNNRVFLGSNVKISHSNIRLKGNNIELHIEENVELNGCVVSLFSGCSMVIKANTTMGNGEITVAEETSLNIGDDCMFAHGYEIRTSDMHPIYDLKTGQRLNFGASISIGNHVWLGRDVVILKGASISDNVVIGINSVVSKDIDIRNSIAIGSPAKVIRKDVIWGRKMFHKTMYDDPTLSGIIRNNRVEND